MKAFQNFDRRRACAESILFLAGWITFGAFIGFEKSLYVILIPMAVSNFALMSYIATNHFMRPQSEDNDPVANSMSVNTLPIIDFFHLNFSHHVEHHLFPKMNPYHAPKMRDWLTTTLGNQYVSPPHWKAILYLYRTPRVYKDATTLVDANNTDRMMAIADITEILETKPMGSPVGVVI